MFRSFPALLLALLSFVVLPTTPASAAGADESAAVKKLGQTFFKEYLASKDPSAYMEKSPLLTPDARHAYLTIKKKADKDGGLDSDPVTGGQDHPKSYQIVDVSVQTDKAMAVAEAKGFTSIFIRFVKEKNDWKINSVGGVNPEKKH